MVRTVRGISVIQSPLFVGLLKVKIRLCYKYQPVNAAWRKKLCFFLQRLRNFGAGVRRAAAILSTTDRIYDGGPMIL